MACQWPPLHHETDETGRHCTMTSITRLNSFFGFQCSTVLVELQTMPTDVVEFRLSMHQALFLPFLGLVFQLAALGLELDLLSVSSVSFAEDLHQVFECAYASGL